jgi:hypothetical protein
LFEGPDGKPAGEPSLVDVTVQFTDPVRTLREQLGLQDTQMILDPAGAAIAREEESKRLVIEIFGEHLKDVASPVLQVRIRTVAAAAQPGEKPAPAKPKTDAEVMAENEARAKLLKSRTELLNAEKDSLAAARDLEAARDAAGREAMDARQKLLDRLRVTVPDLTAPVGKDMVESAALRRDFSAEASTRLFTAGGGKLAADHSDFFSLNIAQRDDLLDRVGFYRGIVIDHGQATTTARSFRDVLQRLDLQGDAASRARLKSLADTEAKPAAAQTALTLTINTGAAAVTAGAQPAAGQPAAAPTTPAVAANPAPPPAASPPAALPSPPPAAPAWREQFRNVPTRLLYRKPELSGYYETHYTFSEQTHQAQKNGVSSLSFSVAAAGGSPTFQGGLGAAYGSAEISQTGAADAGKTVYVTTSYVLPKIELSFEDREACASDAFVEAVLDALQKRPGAPDPWPHLHETAERLMAALKLFGHFAARRMVVGGRLYGVKVQELTAKERASDVARNTYLGVKGEVSHVAATVQASAEKKESDRKQTKAGETAEKQGVTLNSVGGEGQFLSDAGEWAGSLGNYRRWSAVMQEDLVPTIALLPPDLYLGCQQILRAWAETHTIDELMAAGAHFLFYNQYRQIAGQYARPTWFRLRNRLKTEEALTILNTDLSANVDVGVRRVPDDQDPCLQLWYADGLGRIVAYRRTEMSELALSVRAPGPLPANGARPAPGDCPLAITDLDLAPYQTWTLTRSGHLYNIGLAAGVTETGRLEGEILQRFALSDLWQAEPLSAAELKELDVSQVNRIAPKRRAGRAARSGGPADHGLPQEPFILFAALRAARPVGLPPHEEMAVSVQYPGGADSNGQKLVMQRLSNGPHQIWSADADGRIYSLLEREGRRELCLTWTPDGLALAPKDPARGKNQLWRYEPESQRLVRRETGEVMALSTPHCAVDTHAAQALRTELASGGGFKAFRLGKPADDQFADDFGTAKTRSWLLRQAFGGGHGCQVVISNESRHAVTVKDWRSLRGDFAGGPPAEIPAPQGLQSQGQGSRGRLVSAYVYNRVGRGDAVGWLALAGPGADDRFDVVFGAPNGRDNRAEIFAGGKAFDHAALFDRWDNASTRQGGEATFGAFTIGYMFDDTSTGFPTLTLVIRDKA